MSVQFRPEIAEFAAYVPGLSTDEIRSRYGVERVIKLASNENPLGVSPLVRQALQGHAADVFRYPAGGNPRLVAALAAHHAAAGVAPEQVVVGNGSDEIIDLLFRLVAEPGVHNAVAFRPCFGIYPTQARLAGVELRQTALNEDFSFPWDKLLALVDERTRLVFVTSPDNPSGYLPEVDDLRRLAEQLPATCLLVLDEAYIDFAEQGEAAASFLPHLKDFPNAVVLRTFSKSRGLAGLRLGYGILPPAVAAMYWRVRLPFSVNILAEEAGLAALQDEVFHAETLRVVREGRAQLAAGLTRLGCIPQPSAANFVLFRVPDNQQTTNVHEGLLRQGIIIRPLKSYGLPQHMRVTVGTSEENRLFLTALEAALN